MHFLSFSVTIGKRYGYKQSVPSSVTLGTEHTSVTNDTNRTVAIYVWKLFLVEPNMIANFETTFRKVCPVKIFVVCSHTWSPLEHSAVIDDPLLWLPLPKFAVLSRSLYYRACSFILFKIQFYLVARTMTEIATIFLIAKDAKVQSKSIFSLWTIRVKN